MDTGLERLRAALAGRYAVEQELGRGGMAVVYLGRDLKLNRPVAIKVFEREGALGAGEATRFLREVRIAAQLQHPNILPVHDTGEAGGLIYYVMPYVAGATLRERLEREGPLPLADAVRIGREVAEALDHAHRAGIVHRDIKPDNIMLADGVAMVADFGIARAVEQSGTTLTEAGMAVGTPTYMSPEQATASPVIDGRADLYALGCVLYEMLAGAPPFSGPTAQAVMARHTADQVPPISTVRPVSPALEAAVVKALAKLPVDRWPTGKAFATALSSDALREATPTPGSGWLAARGTRWTAVRVGIASAAVVAVVAGAWFGTARLRGEAGGAVRTARSVAVLPFTIEGDPVHRDLADGLTEGVLTGLVRVEGLSVPALGQVARYREQPEEPRAAGRALGAGAVVSGNVRVAGNRFRVTTQLVDVATGRVLWGDQHDGELLVNGQLQDVFTIQDAITFKIVGALVPQLTLASRAASARGVRTRDAEAYRLYLEARRPGGLDKASVERRIALLERAIARDSLFADAWLALSEVLETYAGYSAASPQETNAAIRRAVNRAIELDSLSGDALQARAWNRVFHDWDLEGAGRDLRRAVRLAPASANVAGSYGAYKTYLNEPDSALAYFRKAVSIEPSNPWGWIDLAWGFAFAGRRDSALAAINHVFALDSSVWTVCYLQAKLYLAAGRRAEADSAIARFVRLGGDLAQVVGNAAVYYSRAGDRAGVERMSARLRAIEHERPFGTATARSLIRFALGDRAGALTAMEEAARARERLLPLSFTDLSALRGEPRFDAITRQFYGDRPLPPYPF